MAAEQDNGVQLLGQALRFGVCGAVHRSRLPRVSDTALLAPSSSDSLQPVHQRQTVCRIKAVAVSAVKGRNSGILFWATASLIGACLFALIAKSAYDEASGNTYGNSAEAGPIQSLGIVSVLAVAAPSPAAP